MAVIQNESDTILQGAGSRIVSTPLPPNVSVPSGQVSGLGGLALKNTVTADVMAANSITAANGAIADLSVDRLKITGLLYASVSVGLFYGKAYGTYNHYSGRRVLPYGGIAYDSSYPITGVNVSNPTSSSFDYSVFSYQDKGGGGDPNPGPVTIQFGYL